MYYFDRDYLKEFLDLGVKLEVYTEKGGMWFSITSEDDIQDPETGVAYDQFGKPFKFNYREITQIKADGNAMSIEQLQDVIDGNTEPDDADTSEPGDESGDDFGSDMPELGNEPDTGADNGPESQDSEEDTGKPEKRKEHYSPRQVLGAMINEAKKTKTFVGRFVTNTDKNCEFYKTTGIIVEHDTNANEFEYKIYKSSKTSQLGKTVIKPIDKLVLHS